MQRIVATLLMLSLSALAGAVEYRVGPTQTFTGLQALLDARDLAPGDVVIVDGNHTYAVGSGIVVREDDGGSAAQPVIIRGERINGNRPVLSGGANTIKFQNSDYVVLEGFEITGGSARCVFHDAHEVALRDVLVRNCPNHGVHSADLAGSLTIEYSELHSIGSAGNDQKHTIYAQTGEIEHPDAVFRLRHSYLHNGLSGNMVKSRAERTELHYNWIEGADVQDVEMLSPDPNFQSNNWDDDTAIEYGEMVGNVIVHGGGSSDYAVRLGGDGTGAGSKGRYRLVNNTFVYDGGGTVLRLFAALESVEVHNSVFVRRSGSGNVQVYRDVEADWLQSRQIHGGNNWVDSNTTTLPSEWTLTASAANAGFVDAAAYNLTPTATSGLRDHGNNAPQSRPAFAFPNPSPMPPAFLPKRAAQRPGQAVPRVLDGVVDAGAFEYVSGNGLFANGFE